MKLADQINAPIPDTGMGKLHSADGATRNMPAGDDDINSFDAGHAAVQDIDEHAAGNQAGAWEHHRDNIHAAEFKFMLYFATLDNPGNAHDAWKGTTAQKIREHVTNSLKYLAEFRTAAYRMPVLLNTLSNDLGTAKQFFNDPNWQTYQNALTNATSSAAREDIRNIYAGVAHRFIEDRYQPPIKDIAGQHPDVTGLLPPTIDTPAAGPAAGGTPRGPAGGGGIPPGGLGTPEVSAAGAGATSTGPNAPPAGPSPGGAGDAASQAAGAAKDGAGQAGNAAQQAATKALDAAKLGGNRPPERVLNLGPKSAHGGATRGGGRTRGAGPGARLVESRMAQPGKAATSPAVPVSRAGISNAGSAGAGAPVAGQRRDEASKVHKANRALHTQKNGDELLGESEDAVIPVLGDRPANTPPAKP